MISKCLRTVVLCGLAAICASGQVAVFDSSGDVGVTPLKGKTEFDSSTGEYRITGGGANMWETADAFQFAWKKVSGDMALTADVHFIGTGVEEHRKAALMIRQSLDADSAYADVALHGDGLTSLQYRSTAGAITEEVQSKLKAPERLRIERRGDRFTMYVGAPGGELTPAGPVSVVLQDPVYVGLAVCSHNANVLETAVFSNVKLEQLPPVSARRPRFRSKISIYDLRDKSIRTLYQADAVFEAPSWSPDGKYLLSNSGGRLFRFAVDGAASAPEPIALDPSLDCNNDKGFSPDGKRLAFSASSHASGGSQVYVAGADGSNPKMLVSVAPSYFHGWSPDGKFLAFVGERNGKFGLYRVPAAGGTEQQLTSKPGYDDGPDYSPDGKWIYFNSNRTGGWDIWRMPASGAGPGDEKAQRVTDDELEDWFPHPSPDRKWLLIFSFPKGTATHDDRIDGVEIRMIPLPGKKLKPGPIQVLARFFGGQGSINVNSWSPDSTRFAFVIFEPLQGGTSR